MALRIIAFAGLIFLRFLIATPSVNAEATGQEGRSDNGRWSAGPYSTRDYLERNGPHELLNLAIVRKEIRVTEAQSADLKALQTKDNKALREIKFSAEDRLNGLDPMVVMQAARKEYHVQKQEMLKLGTSQILVSAQNRRLREISLQLEGILAVARPEIQEALNMNQSQRVNIEKIRQEYDQSKITIYRKNSAIRKNAPRPTSKAEADRLRADKERNKAKIELYEKTKAEFDAMRERAEAQIKRWLTRRQEEKFKKLCGEPFKELEMLSIPGFDWKREELRRQQEESKEVSKKEEPKKEG